MDGGDSWEGILDQGEVIIWQGRPEKGVVWSDLLSFDTLFGLFFGGFALAWIVIAVSNVARTSSAMVHLFPLFGVPFLLVGLYLAFGRLLWDEYKRRCTYYSLSNRSAYVACTCFGIRQLERHPILPQHIVTLEDNTPGSVLFKKAKQRDSDFAGLTDGSIPVGFLRINDARAVYRMVRDIQKQRLALD